MAKAKFKTGDIVIWNDERAVVISVTGGRVKIQTESVKKLGYHFITSVFANELKLLKQTVKEDQSAVVE